MDFASLMSAQIAKSKKPETEKANSNSTEPAKKFLKRSEVEAQRQAAYLAEQKALEEEKLRRLERKRKSEQEEDERRRERDEKRRRLAEESRKHREEKAEQEERARRKRLGLPELPPREVEDRDATPIPDDDIADGELIEQLRKLGQPARLFGESHAQRLKRYRKLTNRDPSSTPKPQLSDGPIPTTLLPVPEAEMKVEVKLPKDAEARNLLYRKLASYFNMVIREWQVALAQRADEVKTSFQGKQAYNAMVQAKDNLVPFFRRLEKSEIEDSVLEPVLEIVNAAQERRYVDANDGYLRLAIGKAAWPIGVTMVGIHERSAREKLHESDKGSAHIMSDEITRKYLQSIKRCLSFAQTRWPPDDQLQLMG